MGEAREAPKEAEALLSCSFCRKDQKQVKKLVAGREGVTICNECVELIVEMFEDEGVWTSKR